MIQPAHAELADLLRSERPKTESHGRAVARTATRIGAALGFSNRVQARLRLAASLHDVGKLLIPLETLEKPGPLDQAQWAQIRLHPILGEQMLNGEGLTEIGTWVRGHHERFDGGGYPDGLAGDEIPVEARVLCVADAHDAMVSERPYSEAMSRAEAREELRRGAGGQFDPGVVATFLDLQGDRRSPRPPAGLPISADASC